MGPSQQQPRHRVFGGQVLAQSLIAGSRTVPEGRGVHSMHGYFLRPGDANKPITFGVQRLRDGRSFSARRVHAYQEGMPILSMIASFQDEDEGIEHQSEMPAGIPGPGVAAEHGGPAGQVRPSRGTPLGLRAALRHPARRPGPVCLGQGAQGAAQRRLDEDLRSDAGRSGAAPRRPGLRQRLHHPGIHPPQARDELDYARACRWRAWTTPCGGTGRSGWTSGCSTSRSPPAPRAPAGLATGKIFSRDGLHVATVAQEGMIRVPTDLKNKVRGAVQSKVLQHQMRKAERG